MNDGSVQQAMLPVVELISVVVCGYDVQQEDVLCLRVQTGDAEFHLGEHLSVEYIPHMFKLEILKELRAVF